MKREKGFSLYTLEKFKNLGWFLSPYKKERNLIIEDMERIQAESVFGVQLRVIPPDMKVLPDFHADGASLHDRFRQDKGRFLCTYFGQVTQGLLPDDIECVQSNGRNGQIYMPKEDARPFAFNVGDIWRQAVTNNIHDATPFIHRGVPGPRLMFIS